MLVVSNIDLALETPIMKPSAFLESSIKDFTLNINNDYRYLKTGYYVSLHAEVLGNCVIPSTENIVDAYRTPILLLRASKAGIPTMPFVVADSVKQIMSNFDFPTVVFAVNPFSFEGFRIAKNRGSLYRAVKSLSMNYKFAVCAQPLLGEIVSFNSIFGRCEVKEQVHKIAEEVYSLFKIPLCKLHVQLVGEKAFLSGLQQIRKDELTQLDLQLLHGEVSRLIRDGERLVG
ncbi:MAG: RimK-like ATPgrasp N-terminal domain-containing protein [Candidatus Bathyarchaeales archaeon]